jgi:D-lactate dehydrogenase (cytochrome)
VDDCLRALKENAPLTVQGTRTGITGAAVPMRGNVLAFSEFSGITGISVEAEVFTIDVLPGTTLKEIRDAVHRKKFDAGAFDEASHAALDRFQSAPPHFFAPDPTETTASIGGMFNTNAGGPASYHYGRTADHVVAAEIRTPNGELFSIKRGLHTFDPEGRCLLPNGRILQVEYPKIAMTPLPLSPMPDMDLLDLFAGSEGMLGIVEKMRLRLTLAPRSKWSIVFFFADSALAAKFAEAVVRISVSWRQCVLTALEYLDKHSINFFIKHRSMASNLSAIPEPRKDTCAIIIDIVAERAEQIEAALLSFSDAFHAESEYDAYLNHSWVADTDDRIEKFRMFRHGVPEALNCIVSANRKENPSIAKTAADLCVRNGNLSEILAELQGLSDKAGIAYALFGHAGNKHFHINFLPENDKQQFECGLLMEKLARIAIKYNGTIIAENGVGKLKKELLKKFLPDAQYKLMTQVKNFFDPKGMLNPENMF